MLIHSECYVKSALTLLAVFTNHSNTIPSVLTSQQAGLHNPLSWGTKPNASYRGNSLNPLLQLGSGATEPRGSAVTTLTSGSQSEGENTLSLPTNILGGRLHSLLYHKHDLMPVNPTTDLFHPFESCTFTEQLPRSPFQPSSRILNSSRNRGWIAFSGNIQNPHPHRG
jgi:hypothetical protein